MALNLQDIFRASNPSKTLNYTDESAQKYYVDFSSVRGGQIIKEIKETITFLSPDYPTCDFFTGPIGCGKSTELLRLKYELETEGFHVVYFESSQYLEMTDVDITDILLAIASRVINSIDLFNPEEMINFNELLREAQKLLNSRNSRQDISIIRETHSIGSQIETMMAIANNDATIRSNLRAYLEPRTRRLIDSINHELLQPVTKALKERGKKGLVVIVDNLDRLLTQPKPSGRLQPEYIFIDRGKDLIHLNCHLVYTIPHPLVFSSESKVLVQRLGVQPKVLPMVPIRERDGSECQEGMDLLRQMVLLRAFPNHDLKNMKNIIQSEEILELFDSLGSLSVLCKISGGHVRNLLRFLADWIREERKLPLSRNALEKVIKHNQQGMILGINNEDWNLLCQIAKSKEIKSREIEPDQNYESYKPLLHRMLIYEYIDSQGLWFDVNPVLEGSPEFQDHLEQLGTENLAKNLPTVDSTALTILSEQYDLHEEYLRKENYFKAAEVANRVYQGYQEIASKLPVNTDEYRRVVALVSYWKLMRDQDKSRILS